MIKDFVGEGSYKKTLTFGFCLSVGAVIVQMKLLATQFESQTFEETDFIRQVVCQINCLSFVKYVIMY